MSVLTETTLRAMYLRQLQGLLPPGSAFSRDEDAELTDLLRGASPEYARVHLRGEDLKNEMDPRTTVELLAEWEAAYGLPGVCDTPSTVSERQSVLTAKVVGRGAQTKALVEATALAAGFTAYAKHRGEFPAFRAGVSRAGDPLRSDEWAHYWELVIANPDNENEARLQCIIDDMEQAHTVAKVLVPSSAWVEGGTVTGTGPMAVGDGVLVYIDNDTAHVSIDAGDTFSTHTLATASADALDVIWCPVNKLFIAMGWAASVPMVETSPDGETWTARTVPHVSSYYYRGAHDAAGTICIVGVAGVISSTDGITWTSRGVGSFYNGIAHDYAGTWVRVGASVIHYSADAITWNTATTTIPDDVRTVFYDGARFVATGDGERLYLSTDGDSWDISILPNADIGQIWDVIKIPDYEHYILLHSDTQTMMRSMDGETWFHAEPANVSVGGISKLLFIPAAQGGPTLCASGHSGKFWKANLR